MYVVIEFQQNGQSVATLVNSYADRNLAEQKYHMVLAAAAVSQVEHHSCTMLTGEGKLIKNESYSHEVE